MDALCFGLTAGILHRRISRGRLILGATLGGVYAVASLFLDISALPFARLGALLADIAVCLLLSVIVFARRGENPRRVMGAAAMYTLVSMVMGGVMTALYHLLNRLELSFLTDGDGGTSVSAMLFALLAGIGGLATARGGRVFRQKQAMAACTVTVELDGRSVTVDGMVDSGNLLRDPIGGKPVLVMETSCLAPLLSPGLAAVVSSCSVHRGNGIPTAPTPGAGHGNDPDVACEREPGSSAVSPGRAASAPGEGRASDALLRLSTKDQRRVRLIPTGTATGHGLLVAITVDRLLLTPEGKPPFEVDALVGLTPLAGAPALAMIPAELLCP